MRLALGLLLPFLLAGLASAQARFVEGCVKAVEVTGLDARAACQCAADGTIARGIPAVDLDDLMDYSGVVDTAEVPDEAQAVAAVMSEVLLACTLAEGSGSAYGYGPVSAGDGGRKAKVVGVATAPQGPTAAQAPQGPGDIRTGDGTPPVRTQQSGAGAAIRIVG